MLLALIAGAAMGSVPVLLNKPTWADARPGLNGTRVEMIVDDAGEAVGCGSVDPSAAAVDAVCAQAMARARFKPARDDSGAKVAGVYRFVVGNAPQPPELVLTVSRMPAGVMLATLRFVTATGGNVESCAVDRTSGVTALDGAACNAVTRMRFAPVRDETGAPVRAMRSVSVGFMAGAMPPPN